MDREFVVAPPAAPAIKVIISPVVDREFRLSNVVNIVCRQQLIVFHTTSARISLSALIIVPTLRDRIGRRDYTRQR